MKTKHIILISALQCYPYQNFTPIAAGETLELAQHGFERERKRYKGTPIDFDTIDIVKIPYFSTDITNTETIRHITEEQKKRENRVITGWTLDKK